MSITFKKSVLQRMPVNALRELYIKVFDELPSVGFSCDEDKYNKALIVALASGEKVSDDEDFDEEVPEGAEE
jgi:hypothetical protein